MEEPGNEVTCVVLLVTRLVDSLHHPVTPQNGTLNEGGRYGLSVVPFLTSVS